MERSFVGSILILKEKDGGFLRAEVGRDISMSCEYRMSKEGDSLYSIKWYRDDQEFFRYIPTGQRSQRCSDWSGLLFFDVANYDIIIIIYWRQMFIHQTMQKRRLAFILSN